LEFCGESYDQMSKQRSELPRIRKTTFSGYIGPRGVTTGSAE